MCIIDGWAIEGSGLAESSILVTPCIICTDFHTMTDWLLLSKVPIRAS